jgi:hypothetical protein
VLALVVVPIMVWRNRERTVSVMVATLALLGYVILMQDALRR